MHCGGCQGSCSCRGGSRVAVRGVQVRLGLELAREREGRAVKRTGGLRVHIHKDPSIGG